MCDDDDAHVCLSLQGPEQVEYLRLDRDVEGRRRFVCYEQGRATGQGHRDHHPLKHATRHLMRIIVKAFSGGGDAYLTEHLDGRGPGGLAAKRLM